MEVIDELPPVLVDQHTMTVIDGIHRLEVFRRSGRAEIPATWFTGDSLEARALGIQANIRHGKPLTRSERQTAAMSLLALAPERSDRWLADICGLSHTSVARLRRIFEGAEPNSSSPSRLGRDGRRRPLDPAPGRTQVARAVAEHPSATIRETADIAGVAASTAQRVMAGLRRSGTTASPADGAPTRRLVLTQHPSLGSSPELSEVASWLERTAVTPEDFRTYLEAMPLGRVYEVADECRRRADTWSGLAKSLERRARSNRRNTT
jgi:ParB-like chromosome segregation protein Spo0J